MAIWTAWLIVMATSGKNPNCWMKPTRPPIFSGGSAPHGRWVRITTAAVRDPRGKLIGAIETLEEKTPQRQAEELLKSGARIEPTTRLCSAIPRKRCGAS
jgi:hypothetical protein